MMERRVEKKEKTAEGRTGLQISPRKHRRHLVCACVYVCVMVFWPVSGGLKLMTAMKWDVGGIDFFFFLPVLTKR